MANPTGRPKAVTSPSDVKVDEPKLKEDKNEFENLGKWLNEMYDTSAIPDDKLNELYELLKYAGFNRMEVLKDLRRLTSSIVQAIEIVLACALQGPVRASQVKLSDGRTISQLGIRASGLKGAKGISCARITAATADLAAYYLKKLNVAKRLNMDCPGGLQFPAAGSIKLPDNLRQQHIEFSKRFSEVIGGVFNEQIYMQMVSNAYLDPKLKLFE